MSFIFTCPHCATKTEVEEQFSGQKGKCVVCGGDIQVPHFSEAEITGRTAGKRASGIETKVMGWIAASLVCLLIVGSLLFALIRYGGETMSTLSSGREQTASIKNLEKIAAAMNAYAADFGTYPPPMTTNSAGTPLHSWRVLLLPYLGEDDLYDRLDLSLPWDHPENRMQTDLQIPAVYVHPSGNSFATGSESAYFLITGTGTLFPPKGPLGPADVDDNPTQTILVVEGSPIIAPMSWTDPVDLDFSMMQGRLASNPGVEPGGMIEGGVAVVTVDGRGHFIQDTIDPSVFLSLVTPSGGERLPDDLLD